MTMRSWAREKAVDFVVRHSPDPGALKSPGDLLVFDPMRAYEPPTLMQFGPEPHITSGWVTVGKYSSINGGTRVLLGGGHHPEWVSTFPFRIFYELPGAGEDGQPTTRGPISIGSDVWVGYDAVIMSGVRIGHGAVIGAGSLVTKDVPPYAIVGGNPARLIRMRFDDATVAALLRIRWWSWPHETVLERVAELNNENLAEFIRKYDQPSYPSSN